MKVRIPQEHLVLFRKFYKYLHETKSIDTTHNSFLNFSNELLGHYLGRHNEPEKSYNQSIEEPLTLTDQDNPNQTHPSKKKPPLQLLHEEIYSCKKCFLSERRKKAIQLPKVASSLMVVTDLPSFYDEIQGHYFSDEAGQLLIKIVENLGVSFKKVYYTGAVKCASTIEIDNQLEAIKPCREYLLTEIKLLNPSLVICFGENFFNFFKPYFNLTSDFSENRGKIIPAFNTQIVITHHPRELIFDPSLKKAVWEDLKPFKNQIQRLFNS